MPRDTKIVQVFVASPSDVQSERDILESLITELNNTWSSTVGIIFELLRWETHVRPAFGDDPQSVVNEQLGDSYDVFIGILWGRFGTPTPRALSGTAEEFERAVSRIKRGNGPEVMIYFKETPLSPSKIDPIQLQLVQNFRNSLPARGGVYAVFEDDSDFQSSLRAHLSALAQQFSQGKASHAPKEEVADQTITVDIGHDDDLGYFDYIERHESRMAEMTAALGAITDATSRIGDQMTQRANAINQFGSEAPDIKTARQLVKKAADDMDAYAHILGKQLPLMSSSREAAMHALTRALTLYEDFADTDQDTNLVDLRASLVQLADTATTSKDGLSDFRATIHGLPRMTSELNHAKRAVAGHLDAMLSEIDKTIHTIENIVSSIDRMIT